MEPAENKRADCKKPAPLDTITLNASNYYLKK